MSARLSDVEVLLGLAGHETFAYGQRSYDGDACRNCQWQGPPGSGRNHASETRRELVTDWLAARLAEAEQAAERWVTAVEALADEWARDPDCRTYHGDRARDLRALVAQQRDGGTS